MGGEGGGGGGRGNPGSFSSGWDDRHFSNVVLKGYTQKTILMNLGVNTSGSL